MAATRPLKVLCRERIDGDVFHTEVKAPVERLHVRNAELTLGPTTERGSPPSASRTLSSAQRA